MTIRSMNKDLCSSAKKIPSERPNLAKVEIVPFGEKKRKKLTLTFPINISCFIFFDEIT